MLAALGLGLMGCEGLDLNGIAEQAKEQLEQSGYLTACTAEQPVCEPGCSGEQACVYVENGCQCVSAGAGASSSAEGGRAASGGYTGEGSAPPEYGYMGGGETGGNAGGEPALLPRPSRSTTVDLTADDRLLAMVNTDEGSVSFFDVRDGYRTRISRVATSYKLALSEPMGVVFHPDQKRAFVANRAAGTVSRIVDVQSPEAHLDAEIDFGGEPIGLALDPIGRTLWATNWVTGRVHVIDTDSMRVVQDIAVGGNPWAITITNDGDLDRDDEKVLVTQFYGRRRQYVASEATDDGREGVVQIIDTYDPSKVRELTLAPLERCFESPDLASGCFPNQLLGITLHQAYGYTRAYVVSVAASPFGPVQFNHNVQALVSIVDVEQEREVGNLNLNTGVAAQVDNDGDDTIGRRFLNVPNAIEFVNAPDRAIGYVTAAGSDIVLRVAFNADGTAEIGAPGAFNIPAGQNPTGLISTHQAEYPLAFVSNLISRDVSVLALAEQRKITDIVSTEQPAQGTPEFDIWRGKRFFNTATGIWAREGWGSCQGCHPMGLTDNVTWQFAAGPRQTIALDGQFNSHDPADMRALNWTPIFDESDDFENNTRGTSGGTGAIRNDDGPIVSPGAPAATPFVAVVMEDGVTTENHQNLSGSMKFLSRNGQVCTNEETCPNWDQIDAYIQTIRSSNAYVRDAASAQRGRLVFEQGGCNNCHAGAKWTISRTFYKPELFSGELGDPRLFEANRALQTPLDASPLLDLGLPEDVNVDATLLAGDDSDGGTPALIRQACNVRNVGTFAAEGGAAELRANQQPAQGNNGFNPPSLLSLATGAPFFHNGAAERLEAIFDERFYRHLTSGNADFYPSEGERADLTAFLLSIDEGTQPFDIIPESVICPLDFSDYVGEGGQGGGYEEDDGYEDSDGYDY